MMGRGTEVGAGIANDPYNLTPNLFRAGRGTGLRIVVLFPSGEGEPDYEELLGVAPSARDKERASERTVASPWADAHRAAAKVYFFLLNQCSPDGVATAASTSLCGTSSPFFSLAIKPLICLIWLSKSACA